MIIFSQVAIIINKYERQFCSYLTPYLSKSQKLKIDFTHDTLRFDVAITENGILTHLFEIKTSDHARRGSNLQIKRIKDAFITTSDGRWFSVGVFLVVYDGDEWKLYDSNDLNNPIDIKRALRMYSLKESKVYGCLKYICCILGGLYSGAFMIHLFRTILCPDTELTIPIISLGVFATLTLLLPMLLEYPRLNKISFGKLSIELRDK